MWRSRRALNVSDFERLASRRLPRGVFDAVSGAAGDELTLRENRAAFDRVWIRPRALAGVHRADASTTVLGEPVSMPVLLAPTGFYGIRHRTAEVAVVRAAGRAGTIFAIGALAGQPLETIVEAAGGPLWYQVYMPADRSLAVPLLARVKAAGIRVLCLTIDTGYELLRRERDIRNRFEMGADLRVNHRTLLTAVSKPGWTRDFLLGRGEGGVLRPAAVRDFDARIARVEMASWDDVKWVREHWEGRLVLKGVMRADEVEQMVSLGIDGLVVSNHGGRNLDSVRASIDVLPEVVSAAGGRVEIYVDGGVRRGTDVLKALALGARAVLIGRPYVWALAAGGERGVSAVLEFFRAELERSMALAGCGVVADVDRSFVSLPSEPRRGGATDR